MKRVWMMGALLGLVGVSCAPTIYVVDRHTVLEEEAAGEWPDFEKSALEKSKEQGPTAFQKTKINAREKRLYNVLNGELVDPETPKAKN